MEKTGEQIELLKKKIPEYKEELLGMVKKILYLRSNE